MSEKVRVILNGETFEAFTRDKKKCLQTILEGHSKSGIRGLVWFYPDGDKVS